MFGLAWGQQFAAPVQANTWNHVDLDESITQTK